MTPECIIGFVINSYNFRFRSLQALNIQILSNRCRNKYDPIISRLFKISVLPVGLTNSGRMTPECIIGLVINLGVGMGDDEFCDEDIITC